MADIEMTSLDGGFKGTDDNRAAALTPPSRKIIIAWLGATIALFLGQHCILPFGCLFLNCGLHVDDYLYLVPAMIFSILAVLCISLYTLRHMLLWWRYRRGGGEAPTLPKLSLRDLPKVVLVAVLMVTERALYRYAYQFSLGLELTILRATLPFMYLIYTFGTTTGSQASFTLLGLLAGLIAFFNSSPVSPLAMSIALLLNFLLISIILRTHSALSEMTIVAFLLQLSIILAPVFWILVHVVKDTFWLHFQWDQAVSRYMFGNGILGAVQVVLGCVLIRDTVAEYSIPVFALGAILTDILASSMLHQSILGVSSLGLIVAGALCIVSLVRMPSSSIKRPSNTSRIFAFLIIAAFILHLIIFGVYFFVQDHQPITRLIERASSVFESYTNTASSTTLEDAVNEYVRRYQRPPPPGFDLWYNFAVDRKSRIINEYDQIVNDLRPFWGVEPRELRHRLAKVAGNDWNNIGMVSIRNREPIIAMAPQWLWMPEQMVKMISTFVDHLPDMDILLNENDECRLLLPWADKQTLLEKELNSRENPVEHYTNTYPKMDWLGVVETNTTDFVELSVQPVWDFTIKGCSPTSPAQTYLLSGPHLQSVSVAQNTLSSIMRSTRYVSSYTAASDICSQPDLRYASGFFMAPAAFKGTHLPIPIFSQSRVEPYNDILAPSPWYYSGRARYEPEKDVDWDKKDDTFFWRGATTNGVSRDGGWRFHVRERFMRVAERLRGKVDVGFTEIVRCRGDDCREEADEFTLKKNVQFEVFFKYRYLPDIDGAAFSGRWIAFLKSKGLPFKMALFREWFDSRIVAWRHFIPLDLRLRERDFKAVVQWFMSPENQIWSKRIADWGSEWALQTLRNEDAEVYMFRLLLEYARVMNDDRDKLGFVLSDVNG